MRHILLAKPKEPKQTKNKIPLTILILALLTISLTIPAMAAAANTNWSLQIIDSDQTTIVTRDEVVALPKTTVNAELLCYGSLVTTGDWSGIKVSDLLSIAGINPAAGSIDFMAGDGYKVTIPIDMAMRSDVIIAYELDGNSLSETLRLVIPGANGNLWISMITSLTMSATQISGGESQDVSSITSGRSPGLTNATEQPSTQQPQVQPTPTTPETTINPTATPTNTTQTQPVQKAAEQQNSSFPVEFVYWGMLGAVVAAVLLGFVVYRRGKVKV